MPTCALPRKYDSATANANARLHCQLQYVLTVSRFAHYMKSIMRDRMGLWLSRAEWERQLNEWLLSYVIVDDEASEEMKAEFPLREARVDVVDAPGRPGV